MASAAQFQEMSDGVWSTVNMLLAILVFIMYCSSSGEKLTQAMFFHCDASLLKYGYYRTPEAIISSFRIRLRYMIRTECPFIAAFCAGVFINLMLLGRFRNILQIIAILFCIVMLSVFFSVLFLCMYYIFQPFTEAGNTTSVGYKICTIGIYLVAYSCLQIHTPPTYFAAIILGVTVVTLVAALLLVWKLVRFLVRLVTLPTSHHSLKNTSATNWVSVLKKSLQVLPRDLHAEYFAVLASIATSIERMATEIRGLQKSEQREVEEFFAKGQKGSSAMPHKRNPIGSENMPGLARVIRGHMVTAYENVALWHERDISHSSAERIIAPDTTILIDYMLNRFGNIVKNLTVFPENMIRNMNSTFGLIFSQRAMLTLIEKGMTREQAYDLVQPKTAQSWDNQVDFKPLLEADPEVTSRLTQEEIDEIFNPVYYTKRVDEIFERIGLGD